jgi:IS605 OrfB family transposase
MNALGFTQLEMFLTAFAPIFRSAVVETVNHLLGLEPRMGNQPDPIPLLATEPFNKSSWNTHLQHCYQINKRYANGIISFAKGKVDASRKHRAIHIKTIAGKIKSIKSWLKKAEHKLQLAHKFYAKQNWQKSKTSCNFPLSCSLEYRSTNWANLKFQIHGKKRKLALLISKLARLKSTPIQVSIPRGNVYVVGSKDESFGNSVCQWDGDRISIRVPKCLEADFGKVIIAVIGDFDRGIDRLPLAGARTWHFYRKDYRWVAAVQFTPAPVERVSLSVDYGCIGIDLNPGVIGWAYVDREGNLKAKGQIPLQVGLPTGQQDAQITNACLQIAVLANTFKCPVVCEELDFSKKKEQLSEKSRKYARMLSSWAYSRFYELLGAILANRGIELKSVNPAYSSVIGLVKYLKMYALSSDCAAAITIARRAMGFSERPPSSITAYSSVNEDKHVWSFWYQLNKQIKRSGIINRRHDYFTVSNWSFLVNLSQEEA